MRGSPDCDYSTWDSVSVHSKTPNNPQDINFERLIQGHHGHVDGVHIWGGKDKLNLSWDVKEALLQAIRLDRAGVLALMSVMVDWLGHE